MGNNLAIAITESLDAAVSPPQEHDIYVIPRWTLKRFVEWLKKKYDFQCSRETCRQVLKKRGFSWKKARKLLNKASPSARKAFVEQLTPLLKSATQGKRQIIYIDEAHIHLDTDEGYGWSVKGERFWVSSSSPGLAKVSFYGIYFYNQGKVDILPYDKANGVNTVEVLQAIRKACPDQPITLIWDGASYHRSAIVIDAAKELDIQLQKLPAYSPDFMPVEHLWQWLREDVTYHTCYDNKEKLITQVESFKVCINGEPCQLADRLWTKTSIDFREEELRFST